MTPYITRRTNRLPWDWCVTAAMHRATGPVPDGDLVKAEDLSPRYAQAILQGREHHSNRVPCEYHADTKRAALRRLWLEL